MIVLAIVGGIAGSVTFGFYAGWIARRVSDRYTCKECLKDRIRYGMFLDGVEYVPVSDNMMTAPSEE